jgi:hypothetical protein
MEKVLYPVALIIIFFLLIQLSDFNTRLHEFGHAIGCGLAGGETKEIVITTASGYVSCDIKNPNSWQKFLVYMSGIYTELVFTSILLAVPKTSVLGGLYLQYVGLNFLTKAYKTDLETLSLGFLIEPPWNLLILMTTTVIFCISVYVYLRAWERVGKK